MTILQEAIQLNYRNDACGTFFVIVAVVFRVQQLGKRMSRYCRIGIL